MTAEAIDHPPKKREQGLVIKELPEEVLVYDLDRDKAHCLNNTAALVWKNCDGKTTANAIARLLEKETDKPIDDRVVWLALDQLERFHLLEDTPAKPVHLAGMSRRELVRKVGVAALALPAIISIAAPTAQAQASCVPTDSGPCDATTNCCSGVGNCKNPNKCN